MFCFFPNFAEISNQKLQQYLVSQSETTAFEAERPRVGRERSAKALWSFAASRFPGSGAISKSPVAFCSEQPEGTVGI